MSTKETRINLPKEFTGDRAHLNSFLQDVDLYLVMNGHIYDSDDKKIVFILSFLTDGTARVWKESFLSAKEKNGGGYNLGTVISFVKALKEAFAPSDIAGNARASLRNLKQTGTADEYVSQFRILAGRSGITDSVPLIEYFMEGLKPSILDKIYALEKIPSTIDGWYTHATRVDNQWHRAQEIKARSKGTTPLKVKKTNHFTPRYTNTPDPNAMDIDRLTMEERTEHMKKGLCFDCHQPGHVGKDCPNKKKNTTRPLNFKKKGTTTYATIRALTKDLDEEEKEEIRQYLESEGF